MLKVNCSRCQKKVDSNLTQKCGHCSLEPLCEKCLSMVVHNCKGETMDENDIEITDLVMKMINAIDDLQIARNAPGKTEQDAFEALIVVRNEISDRYYA